MVCVFVSEFLVLTRIMSFLFDFEVFLISYLSLMFTEIGKQRDRTERSKRKMVKTVMDKNMDKIKIEN